MAHRNRWFTELKNGWIFPWQAVSRNQVVSVNARMKQQDPGSFSTSVCHGQVSNSWMIYRDIP